MRHLTLLCLLLGLIPPAAAQEARPMTADEAVAIALAANPAVSGAAEAIVQAELDRKDAITNFLPKLSTTYSYTRLNRTPVATFGPLPPILPDAVTTPIGTDTVQHQAFTLRQTLFNGGQFTHLYRVAQENRRRTASDLEAVRQSLAADVKSACYGVLAAQRSAEIARESEALARQHLKVAQEHFANGFVTRADVLKTEVFLAQASQAILDADRDLALAEAGFNVLLNRPIETPVVLADTGEPLPETRTLMDAREKALAGRPDLRALESLLAMAEANISISKSAYWPTVTFQADLTNDRGSSASPSSWTTAWDAMLTVDFTIWDWRSTRNKVDRTRSEHAKLEEDTKLLRRQVELEAESAWRTLKTAERSIATARTGMEAARENLRVATILYREGMGTTTDVLDAQTALSQARNAYYQALYACHAAAGELDRATGGGRSAPAAPSSER